MKVYGSVKPKPKSSLKRCQSVRNCEPRAMYAAKARGGHSVVLLTETD